MICYTQKSVSLYSACAITWILYTHMYIYICMYMYTCIWMRVSKKSGAPNIDPQIVDNLLSGDPTKGPQIAESATYTHSYTFLNYTNNVRSTPKRDYHSPRVPWAAPGLALPAQRLQASKQQGISTPSWL